MALHLLSKLSVFSLISILFSSCWMQGPRTVHAPLFKEKGEVHLGGYANPFEGFELQADYAFNNKLFVLTDLSGFSRRRPNQSSRLTSRALSAGLGYYTTMKKNGRFSLYSGVTYGSIGNSPSNTSNSRNTFVLPYIGANLGFAAKKFESILSLRYSGNYFFNSFNSLEDNWSAIEPVVTLRVGGEKMKFHTQLGLSYPLTNFGEAIFLSSFGLTYRLKTKKK